MPANNQSTDCIEYYIVDRSIWRHTGDVSKQQKNSFGEWATDVINAGGVPESAKELHAEYLKDGDRFRQCVYKVVNPHSAGESAEPVKRATVTRDLLDMDKVMLSVAQKKRCCMSALFGKRNHVVPVDNLTPVQVGPVSRRPSS